MELTELATIIGIVTAVTTILTGIFNFIFRYFEKKSDRDYEARRKAEDYYRPLYGHIAVLDELARGYPRSLETGKAKVFSFKNCKYKELTSKEILDEFKESYDEFASFYIKKKCEGYELFVSEKLKNALNDFWIKAKSLHENNEKLKDNEEIDAFHKSAEETTKIMEKLFGLK